MNYENKNNEFASIDLGELEKRHQRGRIWAGIVLVAGGLLWLAHAMHAPLPDWLFHWPSILILVGVYILGKHGTRKPSGFIVLAVGAVFMAERALPGLSIHHLMWPAVIIIVGLFMMLNPWKRKFNRHSGNTMAFSGDTEFSQEEILNVNAVFGGIDKHIISKNFKGGQVNCVFGGAELNLMQADIQGVVYLEVNTVFGGIELSVPAHWNVKSEITAILGGVDDKRAMQPTELSADKVLILKGNAVFGGIEIKGY